MNNGRVWRGRGAGGPAMWERGGIRPPPPLFRGGFGPRPAAYFPGGPRPWNGPRRGGRGGYNPRGGVDKRFGKFGRGGGGGRGRGDGNYQWKNPNVQDTPGRRLTEEEIGVTEYVGDHAGFNGIIKSRYSDFQVSEISERGEVAKLTDTSVPEPATARREEVREDEELLLCKYNLELLPLETWDRINSLAVNSEPTTERIEVDATGMSKEDRTHIHDAVKKAFGHAIVSSTVTNGDKKLVTFEKYRKGVRIDNRVKWMWGGEYVHFIVHKENCDTMEAAAKIAERLMMSSIKPSAFGYSGTKDRRAKSSQWFSLRRTEPRRIASACRDLRELHVGNFAFSDTHLKLGMLRGNRFRIALRNVTAEDEIVDSCCEQLKENGFINYYGLQRFGTRVDTPTYAIGLKLLQGKFKEAVDDILEPRPGPLQRALETYRETRDAGAAVKHLKRYCHKSLEGRLLRSLSREPNDMLGALNKLARNSRLLYAHSYQSFIWNRCVSHRLRLFGLKPAVGDLVLQEPAVLEDLAVIAGAPEDDSEDEDEKTNSEDAEMDTKNLETENEKNLETLRQSSEFKTESETASETKSPPTATNGVSKEDQARPKIPVKVLTQEDVDSGKYSISDLILPLPGYNIDYPPNVRDYYEELLTKDSIAMDMKHKIKSYSMAGAYRHVVVRPSELAWECVRYTDPFGDLILSDLDEIEGKERTSIVPDGKFKALLLTMSLPSSCYATMALRELLKVDTSGDSQAQQNNYYKVDTAGKEGPGKKGTEGEQKEVSEDAKNSEPPQGKSETQEESTEIKQESSGMKQESSETQQESSETQQESSETQKESSGEAEKRKLEEETGEGSEAKRAKAE